MVYEQGRCEAWRAGIDSTILSLLRQAPLVAGASGRCASLLLAARQACPALAPLLQPAVAWTWGPPVSRPPSSSANVSSPLTTWTPLAGCLHLQLGLQGLHPAGRPDCALMGTCRATVNLPQALRVAMEEALLLDRQGFAVPPAAQNLALQQRHYLTLADQLAGMLVVFYQVRGAWPQRHPRACLPS